MRFVIHLILVLFLSVFYSFSLKAQPERDLTWYDIDAVAQELEVQSGDWIADIGTRDGYYLNHFLAKSGEKGHIFAVDIETSGFDDLHQYMDQWDYPNVTTIYSKENDPLLPDSSLDAVLIRNTFHEFTEPEQMLKQLKKDLKPTGKLAISELFNEGYEGESRKKQEEDHLIDIQFVIDDLEQNGYNVEKRVDKFAENSNSNSGRYYWLLVATPAPGR